MKNGENNKKIVNFYVKEVKDKLLCPNNVKKAFLQEIRQNISNLENETGVLSIEDLYREIGSPDEIARSFESRDDIEQIKAKAKKYRKVKIICAVSLILAILTAIICGIIMLSDDTYYVEFDINETTEETS